MKRIYVEVVTSAGALKRFERTWKRIARGGNEDATIGLGSIAELGALLTPKRLELLRRVAESPGLSIRALAGTLRRDYKNVHTDVCELEASHLLERDARGLVRAPYDEIIIRAPLRKAA